MVTPSERRDGHAEDEPVRGEVDAGGAPDPRGAGAEIYVAVSRRRPCTDRADGGRGHAKRRDRRAPEHAPRGRVAVAQALLRGGPGRLGGAASPGASRGLSPLRWSS